MPLTLFLLRHAKSSWKHPGLSDHARPLNGRGRRSAPAIGAYMAQHGYHPDLILCSSAQRTRETLGLILPYLAGTFECRIEDQIYDAHSAEMVLDRIRDIPEYRSTVLIIGHNPALEDLAEDLCEPAQNKGYHPTNYTAMSEKFPTGALAVLKADLSAWSQLQAKSCTLRDFTVPRDLIDDDKERP